MRGLFLAAAVFAAAIVAAYSAISSTQGADAEGISIEPFVWEFEEDYLPGWPGDDALPVDTVYIKTHEGSAWMSRYDSSAYAITGVDAIRQAVERNRAMGIRTIAWFVPMGDDYDWQLNYARDVIDTGVDALYADIEPYEGFCNWNCGALAEYFWKPLRAERPNAKLGVIYDPRPQHWEQSAVHAWMSVADVGLPMCYWDTFVDQPPWNDPRECVRHAIMGLYHAIAPGRNIEFVPIFQGDTSPGQMQAGLDAVNEIGLTRVSVWRRGVISPEVWSTLAGARDESSPANLARSDVPRRQRLMDEILALHATSPRTPEQSIRFVKLVERARDLGIAF